MEDTEHKGKYGSLIGKEVEVIFVDAVNSSQIHTTPKHGILVSYDSSFITIEYGGRQEMLPISRIIRIKQKEAGK